MCGDAARAGHVGMKAGNERARPCPAADESDAGQEVWSEKAPLLVPYLVHSSRLALRIHS